MNTRVAAIFLIALGSCVGPPVGLHSSTASAKDGILLVSGAVRNFFVMNAGTCPENLEVLAITDANGESYLPGREALLDPWGQPYGYELPRKGVRGYRVLSYGADQVAGGSGPSMDIDNWMIDECDI